MAIDWMVGAKIWVVDGKGNGSEFVVDKVGRKYVTARRGDGWPREIEFRKDDGFSTDKGGHNVHANGHGYYAYASAKHHAEHCRIIRETERLAVRLHGKNPDWNCRQFASGINGAVVDKLHKLLSENGVPE